MIFRDGHVLSYKGRDRFRLTHESRMLHGFSSSNTSNFFGSSAWEYVLETLPKDLEFYKAPTRGYDRVCVRHVSDESHGFRALSAKVGSDFMVQIVFLIL
jgi:hypothetical protein